MALFGEEVDLPDPKLRIALKRGTSTNPKAPQLVGYVMLSLAQAKELVVLAEQIEQGESHVFLRVALWQDRDKTAKYPMSGTVQMSYMSADRMQTEDEDPQKAVNPVTQAPSPWY